MATNFVFWDTQASAARRRRAAYLAIAAVLAGAAFSITLGQVYPHARA